MAKTVRKKDEGYSILGDHGGEVLFLDRTKPPHGNANGTSEAAVLAASILNPADSFMRDQLPPGPSDDDAHALRDFNRAMADVIAKIGAIKETADLHSPEVLVGESLLTPSLVALANEQATAMLNYARAVSTSTSGFFPADYRAEMKEVATDIASSQAEDDVRHLRYFFNNFLAYTTCEPIPDFQIGILKGYTDFLEMRKVYGFDKYFDPGVDTSNNRNSLYTVKNDSRGAADVTLSYYLHLLPITPAVIKTLQDLGVSKAYTDPLGNWIVDKDLTPDEDERFSGKYFTNCTGMFRTAVENFPDYAGPDIYNPIIEDLFSYIKTFRTKAIYVRADGIDVDANLERTEGSSRNLFNPDLAIKIWMMTALNSVWKVLVEDSLGLIKRSEDAVARTIADYQPMGFADMANLLVQAGTSVNAKLIKAATESYAKIGCHIPYNNTVYQFLKSRWAPIFSEYRCATTDKFINNKPVGDRTYSVRLIPELVLPINPYDSQQPKEEASAKRELTSVEDQDKDRGVYFKISRINRVEKDTRSGFLKPSSIYHFDNMLSIFLYGVIGNKAFSAKSYGANFVHKDGTVSSAIAKKILGLNDGILQKAADKMYENAGDDYVLAGPWVRKMPETATGANADSILSLDLHSSFTNRDIIMGYAGNQEYICAYRGLVVTEESEDTAVSSEGLAYRLAIRHTNPLSMAFGIVLPWYSSNLIASGRINERGRKWLEFDTYVVKDAGINAAWTTGTSLSQPVFKADKKDVGNISAKDWFRYVFMKENSSSFGVLDGSTVGNFTVLPNFNSSTGALDGAWLVNLAKQSAVTADDVKGALPSMEGSFFRVKGRYQYDKCARIRSAICMKSGSFDKDDSSAITTVGVAMKSGYFADPGSYIRIQQPVLKSAFDFRSSDGAPVFKARCREVNTFSCRVDISSFAANKYAVKDGKVTFAAPTAEKPALTSALILGSRDTINTALTNWRTAIKDYVWDNCGLIESEKPKAVSLSNRVIDYVMSSFSSAPAISEQSVADINGVALDAAKSAGVNLHLLTRFSTSDIFIIVTGADDGSNTDLAINVLDGNAYCAAHGIGLLTSACEYACDKTTMTVMQQLGMYAASQSSVYTTLYMSKLAHNLSVYVHSDLIKLPKAHEIYTCKNKDIARVIMQYS